MKPDIDEPERLAKGATPGAWDSWLNQVRVAAGRSSVASCAARNGLADAAFIAAANPASILELVAKHRKALGRIAELERERAGMVATSAEDANHFLRYFSASRNPWFDTPPREIDESSAKRTWEVLRSHGATWKGNEP